MSANETMQGQGVANAAGEIKDDIVFERAFDAPAGACVQISPLARRVVAGNPGPFTFTGTCSYLVGDKEAALIDPGPETPGHIEALLAALKGQRLTHILVTHTHKDHSPAARTLRQLTGATIVGCGPHVAARELALGEAHKLDAANDLDYAPDLVMGDGDVLASKGFSLRAVATPGHTMNHLCFELIEEKALFTGDHVMAWSTSIVAPPDGEMAAYMASLDKLRQRDDAIYWPGHGPAVRAPQRFARALINHRRAREVSILKSLAGGARNVEAIVDKVYEGLDPRLRGAASLSTLAHLEDLCGRALVVADGAPTLASHFSLV